MDAEVFLGDVFDGVGFVENDVVVLGQDADAFALKNQVAKEDGVVGDDDVGGVEPAAGAPVKAAGEVGALAAFAVAVFALDGLPDLGRRQFGQVAECAVFGVCRPVGQGDQFHAAVVKEGVLPLLGIVQSPLAEVVAAAFGQTGNKASSISEARSRMSFWMSCCWRLTV